MPFTIGDKVKYLNEEGGGVIIRVIDEKRVEVQGDDGFEYVLNKSDLVSETKNVIDHDEISLRLKGMNMGQKTNQKEESKSNDLSFLMKDYLMLSRQQWTSKDKDFLEIDLHIEELVEKPGYMNDGQKLHYQLAFARDCLEEGMRMGMRRIIFIHGVGGGVLRHELRQWLKTLDYVLIETANYRRYGIGATEVRILNSL